MAMMVTVKTQGMMYRTREEALRQRSDGLELSIRAKPSPMSKWKMTSWPPVK